MKCRAHSKYIEIKFNILTKNCNEWSLIFLGEITSFKLHWVEFGILYMQSSFVQYWKLNLACIKCLFLYREHVTRLKVQLIKFGTVNIGLFVHFVLTHENNGANPTGQKFTVQNTHTILYITLNKQTNLIYVCTHKRIKGTVNSELHLFLESSTLVWVTWTPPYM